MSVVSGMRVLRDMLLKFSADDAILVEEHFSVRQSFLAA